DAFRGRSAEAEARLDELAPLLDEVTNIGDRELYWWARSEVAFAAGRFEESYSAALTAVETHPSEGDFTYGLAARAAIFLEDEERLRWALEGIERIARPGRFRACLHDAYHAAVL